MATVLITGGSRGIGRACVEYFCNRGDRVAFLYRANEKAAREVSEKTGALGLCVDVSDPEAAIDAIDKVRREYGKSTFWSATRGSRRSSSLPKSQTRIGVI